jgi:hypothetical protein
VDYRYLIVIFFFTLQMALGARAVYAGTEELGGSTARRKKKTRVSFTILIRGMPTC